MKWIDRFDAFLNKQQQRQSLSAKADCTVEDLSIACKSLCNAIHRLGLQQARLTLPDMTRGGPAITAVWEAFNEQLLLELSGQSKVQQTLDTLMFFNYLRLQLKANALTAPVETVQ